MKKSIIIYLTIIFISLLLNNAYTEECKTCHKKNFHITGKHKSLKCTDCHEKTEKHYRKNSELNGKNKCLICHKRYKNFINHNKHIQKSYENKIKKVFKHTDKNFYDTNCASCHIETCNDCHNINKKTHNLKKISNDTCLKCHNSYYTGSEYLGLGIRDDHERYQRGIKYKDKYYLKMLPDIHFEKGIECKDCHDMNSLAEGKTYSKTCIDCHKNIDKSIIEHSIKKHLTNLECYACHSAWTKTEFGTFWIRFDNSSYQQYFRWLTVKNKNYVKSSYYITNGKLLFSKNNRGKIAPVRPEYILFYTHLKDDDVVGKENKLMLNDFKAHFPHTVRRETVNCEYCHDNKKVYLKQNYKNRIFFPDKDGLSVKNFYNSSEFNMLNGDFLLEKEINKILEKNNIYYNKYIKKIDNIKKILK